MATEQATRFDRDTEVVPVGDDSFEGRIDPGWWIVNGPNGGYVAAILVRAAGQALGEPDRWPMTTSVHYTSPPREGPVTLSTRVEKVGRTVATVSARMTQDSRLLAIATVDFAAPREEAVPFTSFPVPDVPGPDECEPFPLPGTPTIPLNDRYEERWAAGEPPYSGADRAENAGWFRTEDHRGVDAILAIALADAWIPPFFSRLAAPHMFVVPTVHMSVYLRGGLPRPPGEWVLGSFRTLTSAGGFIEEDGELWSEGGQLLAQSRQLAAVVAIEPPGQGG